jgi:ribosomal protein S18 acetylase RimI-like enzyme
LLTLIPMQTAEFAVFFEVASDNYAKDNVANGRWNASDAPTLAREETKRLLPEGERTTDNYLFVLRDTDLNAEVGYLWYGTMVRGTKKIAFLYQIYIHAQFRRKGYGRQAMHAFETEALKSQHTSLALNVSAINAGALHLYETEGYGASSLAMRKELRRSDA